MSEISVAFPVEATIKKCSRCRMYFAVFSAFPAEVESEWGSNYWQMDPDKMFCPHCGAGPKDRSAMVRCNTEDTIPDLIPNCGEYPCKEKMMGLIEDCGDCVCHGKEVINEMEWYIGEGVGTICFEDVHKEKKREG